MEKCANSDLLALHEQEMEQAERHYDHFSEAVLASNVVYNYEEARNEYIRLSDNFNIDLSFEDWLEENL